MNIKQNKYIYIKWIYISNIKNKKKKKKKKKKNII